MEKTECKDCKHFKQHYSLGDKKLHQVYCGHCMLPGTKIRRPDAKACEGFVSGTPDAQRFVSKEYLSKRLLEYLCSLELLPPIDTNH